MVPLCGKFATVQIKELMIGYSSNINVLGNYFGVDGTARPTWATVRALT